MNDERLCHRSDCHHPESMHGNIGGCLTGLDGGGYCACTKFTPAPQEETGRTIPALLQAFDGLVDGRTTTMVMIDLCARQGCGHERASHGAIGGCLVPLDAGGYCPCPHFHTVRPEETGRTIPARTSDPNTSHKATEAILIKAGSQRTRLLQAFDGLVDGTDEDAMESAVGVSPSSEYAKRCSELREAGYIIPTGEERVGNSGQPRIVSKITAEGEAALQALGHGVTTPAARQRRSRLTDADRHLVNRFGQLVRNPNGAAGSVILQGATAQDLLDLLERLS